MCEDIRKEYLCSRHFMTLLAHHMPLFGTSLFRDGTPVNVALLVISPPRREWVRWSTSSVHGEREDEDNKEAARVERPRNNV